MTLTIRSFETPADYDACVDLQREVWGAKVFEWVPASILMVAQKLGGIAAGAFDESDRLMGFVSGFTGIREEEVVHWSDMLAVRPEVKDQGVGTRLKWHQREVMRGRGINRILWSFDPLQSRNAYVNFSKLGIVVREYVPEMYGESDAHLSQGIGSDRFVALWLLDSERVRGRRDGTLWGPTRSDLADVPSVLGVSPEGGFPAPGELHGGLEEPQVLVPIPTDINAMKEADLSLANRWRQATRGAFMHYLARGYEIRELVRGNRNSFYLLVENQEATS